MSDIAKAYVQIVPSAKGISGKISQALGGEAESAGKKAGGSFSSAFGAALKAAGAGIAAGAAGISALVKSSIESYADYEQLVGGVETLFGAGGKSIEEYAASVGKSVDEVKYDYASLMEGQETIMANASEAYKTAGLSANEYMETVTSFAAALVSSLDGQTDIAATVANQAITDMADNANKMGSSMESIQNAYQGFAKQNYTMLDNLKLGYGGTKSEMERLLADASAIAGVEFSIDSYADIIDAIHVIQTEMGITGTTAKEAGETISGSVSAMKAAWSNLVTGIADDNADFDELIGNVVDSAVTVAHNILPRLQQALGGVGKLVEGLAPVITEALPVLVADVLPPLLSSATSLVGTIGEAILENLPLIVETGLELVLSLAEGIAENLPEIVPTVIDVILDIADILTAPDNLMAVLNAGIAIIVALAGGIIDALPDLLKKGGEIIVNLATVIKEKAPEMLLAAAELLVKLLQGIGEWMSPMIEKGREVVNNIKDAIVGKVNDLKDAGKQLLEGLWNGITDKVEWLKGKVTGVVDKIKSWFTGKDGFDEHSPSKWAEQVFENLMLGGGQGVEAGLPGLKSDVQAAISDVQDQFQLGLRANVAGTNSRLMAAPMAQDVSTADAVSGIVNGLQSAVGNGGGTYVINLVLDGQLLARTTLPALIEAARANGTPILNPA